MNSLDGKDGHYAARASTNTVQESRMMVVRIIRCNALKHLFRSIVAVCCQRNKGRYHTAYLHDEMKCIVEI